MKYLKRLLKLTQTHYYQMLFHHSFSTEFLLGIMFISLQTFLFQNAIFQKLFLFHLFLL